MFIDETEDRRVLSDAILQYDCLIATHMGTKRRRRTVRGWEFYIRWKDGLAYLTSKLLILYR